MRSLLIIFFIFSALSGFSQVAVNVSIVDSNGKPLEGVFVSSRDKLIAKTKDNGICHIKIENNQEVCLHLGGYYDTCLIINYLLDSIKVSLKEKIVVAEEVVVSENKLKKIYSVQTGAIELQTDKMKYLPTIAGEADLMKILQLTPGVSKSDVSMGLNVRGSSTDQNLVLFDGATVYNPTHLASFLSVFNPLVVDKVSLIKSGLPANYGGRLSSITDVITRTNISDTVEGAFNTGMIMTNGMIKVPLFNKKACFYVAARKSYIDEIIKPTMELFVKNKASLLKNVSYSFYDLNAGFNAQLNENNLIYFSFYRGSDDYYLKKASFDIENSIGWNNLALSGRWTHYFSSSHIMKTKVSYSANNFGVEMGQSDFNYQMKSNIEDVGLVNEHTILFEKGNFKFGDELVFMNVTPNKSKAVLNNISRDFGSPNYFKTFTNSLFGQLEYKISQRLLASIGIRNDFYMHYGPYIEFLRNSSREIIDTFNYARNEPVKSYFDLEPRFALRYLLNNTTSLKFSCTRNVQYLHQVNVSAVAFPSDIWLPSSGEILPQRGWQFSGGVYSSTLDNTLTGSIEVFYKKMDHLIEFSSGILSSIARATMEENLLFGNGRSYGLEMFFQKQVFNYQFWISYTLSRTEKKYKEINHGNYFPAKYDRTHDISMLAGYNLNKKWKISAVFVYTTGNAVTVPNGRYLIGGNIVNQYTSYNTFRMPDYHRLDLSLTRSFISKSRFKHQLNFSIYNVYNRKNPYYMYFSVNGDLKSYTFEVKPKFVSLYPVVPTVSYELKF